MGDKNINKTDEYITNKILLVFTAALVFMLLMMVFERTCFTTLSAWMMGLSIAKYGFFVSLAGVAASIVYFILHKLGKRSKARPLITPVEMFVLFALPAVFLASVRWGLSDRTFRYFYMIVPLFAVLYIVYHIYQRDFFVFTLLSGGAGLAFYGIYSAGQQQKYDLLRLMLTIAGIAVFILALLGALYFKSTEGTFKNRRVFAKGTNYLPHFILYGISAVGFVLSLVLGAGIAFYMIFGVAAVLLVSAVYNTIKLI